MCHMCRQVSILNKLAHVSLFTNLASIWPKDAASFSTPQRWPGCCGHSSGLFSGARNLRGGFFQDTPLGLLRLFGSESR